MLDTQLAIASRRDHRRFDVRPLDPQVVERILDAGRLAGSARNRQPWRFVVATDRAARERLSRCVYVPPMVATAPLAVVLVAQTEGSGLAAFDAGRAAQNMMLAAWAEGVASCPNGIAYPDRLAATAGLHAGEIVPAILAFGWPLVARDPARRSRERWSATAKRRPLHELVSRLEG